jgi:hypothetical protein
MYIRYAIAAIGLVVGIPAHADIKDVLAQRLSADAQYLIVNLPPRPDAWPGAIFTSNLRVPITHGNFKDPALRRGALIAIDATETLNASTGAKGVLANWFNASADAGDIADVTMSFPDARVVDMDYSDLVKHVQASNEAIEAAKRGQIPIIIVKSYEATPLVTLSKKATASAEAWAKLKAIIAVGAQKANIAVGAQAGATSVNSVTYKGNEPFVFAFETQQITFNPNDLNAGKVTIQLAFVPSALFALREEASETRLTPRSIEEVTPQSRPHRIVGATGALWLGYAVSPNRRVFRSEPQQGENSARNIAKKECETTTLRACSVVAVPEGTDVSAVGCTYRGRSESFLGGSAVNAQIQIALGKARDRGFPESTCVVFYND